MRIGCLLVLAQMLTGCVSTVQDINLNEYSMFTDRSAIDSKVVIKKVWARGHRDTFDSCEHAVKYALQQLDEQRRKLGASAIVEVRFALDEDGVELVAIPSCYRNIIPSFGAVHGIYVNADVSGIAVK